MAFFACGTRDKLNARPAGATRHFVDDGSLFGTGLIILAGTWWRWYDSLNARGSRLMWDGGIPRPPAGGRASLRRSAPLRVRIPPHAHKKAPRADESPGRSVTLAGTEGFRVRLPAAAPAASLRSLRAALENASRFLSSAPCRVRIPTLG